MYVSEIRETTKEILEHRIFLLSCEFLWRYNLLYISRHTGSKLNVMRIREPSGVLVTDIIKAKNRNNFYISIYNVVAARQLYTRVLIRFELTLDD